MLFPAWAGVILEDVADVEGPCPIPRMGGGDPPDSVPKTFTPYYSPHGRG